MTMSHEATVDAPDQAEQARYAITQLWGEGDATSRLFPENDSRVKTSLLKAARKAIRKHSLNYHDTVRLVNRQRINRLQDRRPGKRYGTWYSKQDFVNLWEKDDPYLGHVDVSNAEVSAHGLYIQHDGILWPVGEEIAPAVSAPIVVAVPQLVDNQSTEISRPMEPHPVQEHDLEPVADMDVQTTQSLAVWPMDLPSNPDDEMNGIESYGEDIDALATMEHAIVDALRSTDASTNPQRVGLTQPSDMLDLEFDCTEIPAEIQTLAPEAHVSSTAIYLLCDALCTSHTRTIDPLFVPVAHTERQLELKPPMRHYEQHHLIVVPLHHPGHWTVGFIDLQLRRLSHYDPLANKKYSSNGGAALQAFAAFYSRSLPETQTQTQPPEWSEETIDAYTQTTPYDCGIAITVAILCTSNSIPVLDTMDCPLWRRVFYAVLLAIAKASSDPRYPLNLHTPYTSEIPLPDLSPSDNLGPRLGHLPLLHSTVDKLYILRGHIDGAWSVVETLRAISAASDEDERRHAEHKRSVTTGSTVISLGPDADLLVLHQQVREMQQTISSWIRTEHGFETRRRGLLAAMEVAGPMHAAYLKAGKTLRVRVGLEMLSAEMTLKSVGERLMEYDATV